MQSLLGRGWQLLRFSQERGGMVHVWDVQLTGVFQMKSLLVASNKFTDSKFSRNKWMIAYLKDGNYLLCLLGTIVEYPCVCMFVWTYVYDTSPDAKFTIVYRRVPKA